MLWQNKQSADIRIINVMSDETSGELTVYVTSDDEKETHSIIYEGMFYSQLDKNSVGVTVISVSEITPEELNRAEHSQMAARLYDECGADEKFLWEMFRRGNHLYVHRIDGGEYVVLAKRITFSTVALPAAGCAAKPAHIP